MAVFLRMNDIHKTFGGIKALKGVTFDLRMGEALGLVGENGAGKSTLMKILCGIEVPDGDSGDIILDDKVVNIANTHRAQELGIGMIPQELVLVPQLSVMENIFLGFEKKTKMGILKKADMIEKTESLLADLHSEYIGPESETGSLPKADQQIVAIARRLLQGGKIFIMDEPTAPLTEKETRNLFSVLDKLCCSGLSIIFISHRLEEVVEICQRVSVLRDGNLVTTLDKEETTIDKPKLVYHMVGSEIMEEFPKIDVERGKEILKLNNISFQTNQGQTVEDISLSIHEGEVVGVTGLVGVGKTELGQTLIGARDLLSGEIMLEGKTVSINSPVAANKLGFGYVSEDRRGEGLVLGMQSLPNMTINSLEKVSQGSVISPKRERALGGEYSSRLTMKQEYLDMEAQQLSGGNQQKVVIIRQIVSDSRIIIFDEPTKGIDVAAKSEVSMLIGELSKEGKAILLLSSEPREVLGISDIIFVLTRSGLEGPFKRENLDYEKLMAIEFGTDSKKGGD